MFLKTAVLFSTLASMVSALTIATPSALVQCQPVALNFEGGEPPFILSVIPGGQTSAPPLLYISDNVQSSPFTWHVNVEPGTQVNVKIVDGRGAEQFTSPLTVQAGSNTNCMKPAESSAAPSEGPASSASAPASSEAPASSAASETPAASSASSAASSAAASASSAAPIPSASTSKPPTTAAPSSSGNSTGTAKPPTSSSAAPQPSNGASFNVVAVPAVAAAVAGALLF